MIEALSTFDALATFPIEEIEIIGQEISINIITEEVIYALL